MPPIWEGFWVENSLNKGILFQQIFLGHGWAWLKFEDKLEVGSFSRKSIIKVGMKATFGM